MKCSQNLHWNHSIHYEIFCEMTWGDTLHCTVSNNISLAKRFSVYVIINCWHFHENDLSYETVFSICLFDLPVKTSLSSMSQLFPIPFASLPSHQLCFVTPPPSSHTAHLTSPFLNSSWWLITMKSYQSHTPIQNKEPTFRHHVHPSVSITVSVPHSWSAQLSFSHRSFTFNSNKSPTWCISFSVYYPDVCLQLNMFRALSRPSSGAQWLQWQPLVLLSYRGDSRTVFVVGPAGLTTNTARLSPW
jgi:hypothetical protein